MWTFTYVTPAADRVDELVELARRDALPGRADDVGGLGSSRRSVPEPASGTPACRPGGSPRFVHRNTLMPPTGGAAPKWMCACVHRRLRGRGTRAGTRSSRCEAAEPAPRTRRCRSWRARAASPRSRVSRSRTSRPPVATATPTHAEQRRPPRRPARAGVSASIHPLPPLRSDVDRGAYARPRAGTESGQGGDALAVRGCRRRTRGRSPRRA